MRISGDRYLNILDLIQMVAHFDRETVLGEEVHILLDELFNKMSKSRVKVKMQYNYANFIKLTTDASKHKTRPCLIDEIEGAFIKQFQKLQENQDVLSDDGKNANIIRMPISGGHKMTVIKDENVQGPEYFEKLAKARDETYRLDKTLIRPPQEFCSYEMDDLEQRVIKVLQDDVTYMIEKAKEVAQEGKI